MKKRTTAWIASTLTALLFIVFAQTAPAQVLVSGKIISEAGLPMAGLTVAAFGTDNQVTFTNGSGNYSFSLPAGGTYEIKPLLTGNWATTYLNGVSTLDLVLINRHATGEQLLTSPYAIIAADVDGSNTVTTTDSLLTRELLLGIIPEFPNVPSWRFVDAAYVFPNPADPFTAPFPESIVIPNLSGPLNNQNLIAIKVGDVNNTAITQSSPDPSVTATIQGKLYFDANGNCAFESGETPLEDWTIIAEGVIGNYTTTSRADGTYTLTLPAGSYTLQAYTPNDLWALCPAAPQSVTLSVLQTVQKDYAAQAQYECPALEVDLSTNFLRRCFSNSYVVRYCNKGTVPADDAYVTVLLDTFFTLTNSTIPWSAANGNAYTFPVGDLPPGQCGSFVVFFDLSCEAALGQTHCTIAHAFPDTLCVPPAGSWSGADLVVEGQCVGNETHFKITNQGAGPAPALEYVVIEDVIIQMNGSLPALAPGASETIVLPANGSTWRLEVDQAPGNPWNIQANAAVEGCGLDENSEWSQGFVNQFPLYDRGRPYEIDCRQNIGAYDPNDKQGFPSGVGAQHFVRPGTEIEYLIRFQNTGTDTAFTVMILDTLDAWLDPATVRPGSSSHAYQYNMLGQGIVQFVFQNIMLPDSNVNEPASNGHVKFSVRPKADAPLNTAVYNQAAIYFDFNEPVITNQTRHTFGEQFLSSGNAVFEPGLQLEVYPNPAVDRAVFFLKSAHPISGFVRLFDTRGHYLRGQAFQSNPFDLNLQNLPEGLYFFRIEAEDGRVLAAGRIVRAMD